MRLLTSIFHFRSVAILATVLAVAAGCDHPTEYVYSTPAGSYTLSTVDGAPLPVLLSTGDSLLAGELTMWEITPAFSETWTYRRGAGVPFSSGAEGMYEQDGTSLRFRESNGLLIGTGSYDNTKLKFVSSHTYVFLRN